jgi:hypothetical protein
MTAAQAFHVAVPDGDLRRAYTQLPQFCAKLRLHLIQRELRSTG